MHHFGLHPGKLQEHVYKGWIDTWLTNSRNGGPPQDIRDAPIIPMAEISRLMRPENIHQMLDQKTVERAVYSFQHHLYAGHLTFGGTKPPSSQHTNLCAPYNPSTSCTCHGLFPVPDNTTLDNIGERTPCEAVRNTLSAIDDMLQRSDEWLPSASSDSSTRSNKSSKEILFTPDGLRDAAEELLLMNADMEPGPPSTCLDPDPTTARPVQASIISRAPDRRPHKEHDTHPLTHQELYPTAEGIKLCADAKYYFVGGCAGSRATATDAGVVRAVMDAGNDVLIGDYCEAADEGTLGTLQDVGCAAWAFLRVVLGASTPGAIASHGDDDDGGREEEEGGAARTPGITQWHFTNLAASALQFRALAHFRDHAQRSGMLPRGVWGSRMTGWTKHRHVDIAVMHGVVPASLAAGAWVRDHGHKNEKHDGTSETCSWHSSSTTLTTPQYARLSELCTLINDLVDLRSDTARQTRENVVLRGVRGSFCHYIRRFVIDRILSLALDVFRESPQVAGRVVMGFCNWAVMGSHHKVFEVLMGTHPRVGDDGRAGGAVCREDGEEEKREREEKYKALRDLVKRTFGSLEGYHDSGGGCGVGLRSPSVWRTRVDMDRSYALIRDLGSAELHEAWLADMMLSLMKPEVLVRIADVVHFEWVGDVGDRGYCP